MPRCRLTGGETAAQTISVTSPRAAFGRPNRSRRCCRRHRWRGCSLALACGRASGRAAERERSAFSPCRSARARVAGLVVASSLDEVVQGPCTGCGFPPPLPLSRWHCSLRPVAGVWLARRRCAGWRRSPGRPLIGVDHLHERVPVPSPPTNRRYRRPGTTVNAMLERIDHGSREKRSSCRCLARAAARRLRLCFRDEVSLRAATSSLPHGNARQHARRCRTQKTIAASSTYPDAGHGSTRAASNCWHSRVHYLGAVAADVAGSPSPARLRGPRASG